MRGSKHKRVWEWRDTWGYDMLDKTTSILKTGKGSFHAFDLETNKAACDPGISLKETSSVATESSKYCGMCCLIIISKPRGLKAGYFP